MLDAADYFLTKQERSLGVSEEEKIKIAVKSLGLDDLKPFNPNEKIIEYVLRDDASTPLLNMNLREFANETAGESPAPGGGSISAYVGALGVSLGTMVANLSAHKRGWDDKWAEYSNWAVQGDFFKEKLLALVDEDTAAFNKIMDAFTLPKATDDEKAVRSQAIEDATKYAMEVPMHVMENSLASMCVMNAMVDSGLQSSLSDAAVGALCARTAVMGAYLNVKINAGGLKDEFFKGEMLKKGADIEAQAIAYEKEILEKVNAKL